MEKFLIINPFGIGDVLFTTPAIKAIRENKPGCFIGYWCNLRVKELLEFNKSIDRIFALSRGDLKKIYARSKLEGLRKSWDLFLGIRKEKFDIALDYSLDQRYGLACKLAGIKKRIGFDYKGRGRFLTDKLAFEGYRDRQVIEYYLDLLKIIGIRPESAELALKLSATDTAKARAFFADYGIKEEDILVGIAPAGGESWGRDAWLKYWPPENFAQLADRLIIDFGVKILLLGDEKERAVAQKVKDEMQQEPIDLVGKTSLAELVRAINNLELLVANDGGSLHIAVTLGKKTVSFFGPTDPAVYGPYPPLAGRHRILKKAMDCSPCYRNFRLSQCLNNRRCLNEVTVEEAYNAAGGLLNKG